MNNFINIFYYYNVIGINCMQASGKGMNYPYLLVWWCLALPLTKPKPRRIATAFDKKVFVIWYNCDQTIKRNFVKSRRDEARRSIWFVLNLIPAICLQFQFMELKLLLTYNIDSLHKCFFQICLKRYILLLRGMP